MCLIWNEASFLDQSHQVVDGRSQVFGIPATLALKDFFYGQMGEKKTLSGATGHHKFIGYLPVFSTTLDPEVYLFCNVNHEGLSHCV